MNACKERAYAKINLFLDCISKREDGYHEVKTVMHSVSLYDEVTVTLVKRDRKNIKILLDGNRRLPTDNKNLCYMAAERFFDRTGIIADVVIRLDKKIPISAGLAGGSSDAAATLRGLNRVFSRPLADKALLDIAAEIGSDVPYCMYGGTANCVGRGEIVERINTDVHLHTVVAIADERVSTPMAYSLLDEMYADFTSPASVLADKHYAELMNYLSCGEAPGDLYNIFESAILPTCPGACELKRKLKSLGAVLTLMSGSGPSVFGIFRTAEEAISAAEQLNKDDARAFYCHTV